MSILSEMNRIKNNVADTYSVLSDLGADMPSALNTNNLPNTAASISAVLYAPQSLTEEQKETARDNIGIKEQISKLNDSIESEGIGYRVQHIAVEMPTNYDWVDDPPTVELEAEKEYEILIDGVSQGFQTLKYSYNAGYGAYVKFSGDIGSASWYLNFYSVPYVDSTYIGKDYPLDITSSNYAFHRSDDVESTIQVVSVETSKINPLYLPDGGFGYTEYNVPVELTPLDVDTSGGMIFPLSETYFDKNSLVGAVVTFSDNSTATILDENVSEFILEGDFLGYEVNIDGYDWGLLLSLSTPVEGLKSGLYSYRYDGVPNVIKVNLVSDVHHKIDKKYLPDTDDASASAQLNDSIVYFEIGPGFNLYIVDKYGYDVSSLEAGVYLIKYFVVAGFDTSIYDSFFESNITPTIVTVEYDYSDELSRYLIVSTDDFEIEYFTDDSSTYQSVRYKNTVLPYYIENLPTITKDNASLMWEGTYNPREMSIEVENDDGGTSLYSLGSLITVTKDYDGYVTIVSHDTMCEFLCTPEGIEVYMSAVAETVIAITDLVLNLESTKQDVLTPGDGISIVDNVISATGGSGGSSISIVRW